MAGMTTYRQCKISVMDNIADPDIEFDIKGICNYYYQWHEKAKLRLFESSEDRLNEIIRNIKEQGKGQDYDCLIGISGGVDSTYLAYLTKKYGLRPLAIHFDNGWNSELAVKNIENTLVKLGIDLFTYVIDWEEFKSLQVGFLRSSTPDGEIPTDHAIFSLFFKVANEKGIKYILNGNNFSTEAIMPRTWSYGHIDWKYIRSINKTFGTCKLKSFPRITPVKFGYYTLFKKIKIISLLNYIPYRKEDAMNVLKNELDWKYYGGKHYESIYTRFFQGFVLPEKFNIDKRKAHLSSLIFAGQISKDEAMEELKKPTYPENLMKEDIEYVRKKLNLTDQEFERIMNLPNKSFIDYPNQSLLLDKMRSTLNKLRGKGLMYS